MGCADRVYSMTFGKYIGKPLDEVPSQYLEWIKDNNVQKDHEDLPQLCVLEVILTQTQAFLLLSKFPEEPDDVVSYDPWTDMKIWISDSDARQFFGDDSRLMRSATSHSWGLGRRTKWWLHQVYRYAEHFGTLGTQKQTVTALRNFLGKNEAREKEIMAQFEPDPCAFPNDSD